MKPTHLTAMLLTSAMLVAVPAFAQTTDAGKQQAQSLSHNAPTKQKAQSLSHNAPTKQKAQSLSHNDVSKQKAQSLSHGDPNAGVTKQH